MSKKHRLSKEDQALIKEHPEIAYITSSDEWIKARTENQKEYIQDLRKKELVIAIGPAGTGKTFLATAVGLQFLKDGEVSKIVITRPVVEAGEHLGFLPGTLDEKINPYLRPIYDAFDAMLSPMMSRKLIDDGIVEVAPLAYMRGRTLENSFIILDEAQNTTIEQLEMLLTRMGHGSRVVVTGDITQIDLPKRNNSGLVTLKEIIGNIPGITFRYFTDVDVVRHPLVREIVKAYEVWKQNKK